MGWEEQDDGREVFVPEHLKRPEQIGSNLPGPKIVAVLVGLALLTGSFLVGRSMGSQPQFSPIQAYLNAESREVSKNCVLLTVLQSVPDQQTGEALVSQLETQAKANGWTVTAKVIGKTTLDDGTVVYAVAAAAEECMHPTAGGINSGS